MVSILAVGGIGANCTPAEKSTIKTVEKDAKIVLNDADVACVLFRRFLGEVPAIAEACNLEEAFVPAIESLLTQAEKVAAADRKVAASKRSDAGAR